MDNPDRVFTLMIGIVPACHLPRPGHRATGHLPDPLPHPLHPTSRPLGGIIQDLNRAMRWKINAKRTKIIGEKIQAIPWMSQI